MARRNPSVEVPMTPELSRVLTDVQTRLGVATPAEAVELSLKMMWALQNQAAKGFTNIWCHTSGGEADQNDDCVFVPGRALVVAGPAKGWDE